LKDRLSYDVVCRHEKPTKLSSYDHLMVLEVLAMPSKLLRLLALLAVVAHAPSSLAQVAYDPGAQKWRPAMKQADDKKGAWTAFPASGEFRCGPSYCTSGPVESTKDSGYGTQENKVFVPYPPSVSFPNQ